ncbi:MAG: hypothetical protein QOF84_1372 [Streptomyces sp.]|nr:hypothetical protein [Streptomyces sp.]
MDDRTGLTLPEELLLLCTVPQTGLLKRPQNFNRVLAGAVLAELLLGGAITVDGKRITGVRPLTTPGDPVADRVVADLARAGKRARALGLERWVRKVSSRVDRPYLEALQARGLLLAGRRRALGIFPYTVWQVVQPGWFKDATARLDRAVGQQGDDRDLALAALAGAIRLDRRLYSGRGHRDTRRRIQRLTRESPIADAVRKVVSSDESAAGSG